MVDRSYREALLDNELVWQSPGAGQELITGAETIGATSATNLDSGILFSELQKWILETYGSGVMFASTYDSNLDGRVDEAEALDDGTNVVTAAQARGHLDDPAVHYPINDAGSSASEAWSASKIDTEVAALNTALADKVGDVPVDDVFYSRRNLTWVPSPRTPTGGLTLAYGYNASTAAADPGSGNIGANQPNLLLASALYVNKTTRLGNPADPAWNTWDNGDFVIISGDQDGTRTAFEVTNVATDNGTWVTLPVTALAGGTVSQANGALVQVGLIADPDSRVPRGGDLNQVLAKASAADFDMQWVAQTGGGGDVEEAPQDGVSYTRRDAGWVAGNRVYQQATPPAAPAIGDIWIDTT